MIHYCANSFITALRQLFVLFGFTFALSWALYQVSMATRMLGYRRLGLLYFYLVSPGVACHETGHALGCLLTCKRIVEFVPFRPRLEKDGVSLGHVKHEAPHTILSQAGEFLVSTGPVWFGSAVIMFLVRLLVGPTPFDCVAGTGVESLPTGVYPYVRAVALSASGLFSKCFAVWRWSGPFDVVLIYLLICVASEVTLSGPDINGMWIGLAAICTLVVVGNFVPFFDMALESGLALVSPWLFVVHATLAFVLILDVCIYGLYRMADALFPSARRQQ